MRFFYFVAALLSQNIIAQHSAAEDWNFIDSTNGNMVGIRNIKEIGSGDFSGYKYLSLLNGYLPNPRIINNKEVASISRTVALRCGSAVAYVLEENHYNAKFETTYHYHGKSATADESLPVKAENDRAIRIAMNHLCNENKSVANPSTNTLRLSCHVNNNVHIVKVDFDNSAVDGKPARIDESSFIWSMGSMFSYINREDGSLYTKDAGGDLIKIGKCYANQERVF